MAYVSVPGIEIVKVAGAGDVSQERVVLRMEESVDLINYVLLNAFSQGSDVSDLNEHVFWFPSVVASQGDYVRLYTRAGEYTLTKGRFGENPARFHNFYWGKDASVWGESPMHSLLSSNAVVLLRISNWIHKKIL